MGDQGVEGGASLRGVDAGDGAAICCIRAQTVNRFRGERDAVPLRHQTRGGGDAVVIRGEQTRFVSRSVAALFLFIRDVLHNFLTTLTVMDCLNDLCPPDHPKADRTQRDCQGEAQKFEADGVANTVAGGAHDDPRHVAGSSRNDALMGRSSSRLTM